MDVTNLGTILGIWAHPDDETMMAGGVMAAAVANGQTVACVTATRGEAGSQDVRKWPASTLGSVRTQELNQALNILGVANHHWLEYADGGCHRIDDQEAVNKLLPLIAKYQPDTILTFPPNGLTGHPDHQAVSRWSLQAVEQCGRPVKVYGAVFTEEKYQTHIKQWDDKLNVFFALDQPVLYSKGQCQLVYELSPDILDKKVNALAAMPSQIATLRKIFPANFIHGAFSEEAFVRLGKL